jgi:hypothetical protein
MNYKVLFQEIDRLEIEKLSKPSAATLEDKRKQFQNIKRQSSSKGEKKRSA